MILRRKPRQLYRCRDGTFSTHKRHGACVWHGGLKSKEPVKLGTRRGGQSADVELIPLREIHVAHQWFQNRAAPYSLRSVQNIVEAAQGGGFKWANLDAITVWRNPADRKLYVLSGHSRHEAFRQLCEAGIKAEGRDFCAIPAKTFTGSLEAAKKLALESNTLSTKETDLERATFYRRQREAGTDAGAMLRLAKRLEGRNANTILAFSFLSPTGKTWAALQALADGQADSRTIIKAVGRWIGNARRRNPQLTDFHENELYEWLVMRKGYGSGAGQVNSEQKFLKRLDSIINRRTTFGKLKESLNIQSAVTLSPVERQYNQRLEDARKQIKELDKELQAKIKNLTARGATAADVARITEPIERALRRARIEYQGLVSSYDQVQEAARNEQRLFGVGSATTGGTGILPVLALVGGIYYLTR
jgi:hypothetical protein